MMVNCFLLLINIEFDVTDCALCVERIRLRLFMFCFKRNEIKNERVHMFVLSSDVIDEDELLTADKFTAWLRTLEWRI